MDRGNVGASAGRAEQVDSARLDSAGDRLLRLALASARIGSWEWDVRTGHMDCSDLVGPVYGLLPGQAPTTHAAFVALIHAPDREQVLASLEQTLSDGLSLFEVQHRVVWPDGAAHWVEVRGHVYRDESGQPQRVAGTVVDVTPRKEAEEKLVASEALMRQLILHTPAAVAMLDRQLRYLQVSERWLSDYHLQGRDVVGRSHYEIFPDVPERWKAVHQRVLAGAVESCDEDPFPREDGTLEWLQWEVRPWRDGGGQVAGLIMFTQVITARKRAEEALRKAEEKFSAVFMEAPVAISITRITDGLLLDVNREFERLFGYTREEAIGRTTVQLGMWPNPDERKQQAAEALASNSAGPRSAEGALRTKDGRILPLSGSVHRLEHDGEQYALAAYSDLTERKRSEAVIRASEARLRRVIASPIVGVAFVGADGAITDANDECLRIIGYTSDEVAAGAVLMSDLTPPDAAVANRRELPERAETGAPKPRELELIRKDGRRAPVLLGISAIDDDRSHEVAFVFDLSERRALERQLQHAQRLEAVGRLAAGIAHDFNNVLAAITMSSELLRDALAPSNVGLEEVTEIRRAADRAVRLIRQLLAFSRQQVLEPHVLDLNELVANLHTMLQRLVGGDVLIETRFGSSLWAIKADPGQLEQVIVNLTVNARDAMPEGGTLIIETENTTFPDDYVTDHGLIACGNYVVLTVRDTGIGMDATTKARMFEPFFTTKEHGKGTGLGLATVYGIVRQSGGAIEVRSELDHGTTLQIFLPSVDEAVEVIQSIRVRESVGGTETVLVVEDDAAVRQVTRKILVGLGYKVLDAAHPAEALQTVSVYVGAVDLLLTDLVMPGGSGRTLARELLTRRPKLRVLYMSGYTDDVAIRQGVLGKGSAYIQKPFGSAALAQKLRSLLDVEEGAE